jgi:hypothetical protein
MDIDWFRLIPLVFLLQKYELFFILPNIWGFFLMQAGRQPFAVASPKSFIF